MNDACITIASINFATCVIIMSMMVVIMAIIISILNNNDYD